ncbi:hypothetical protein CWI37_1273p0010 [Hamiltosporidium tvaerminnensis]|uniref:Uncharacterized protein n=1 Tax=Hamiltosporidium tvaerminnensis TaxID=1176355 RepID=A0A4Q9KZG8_9MICR|nr:hypothetical protein CWI37_1273p0010 [Hamiltosporidium tvaerminnensis]
MKTVKTISFDRRRGTDVILGAERHKQPKPSLKQVDNEEDGVKTQNTKNILPLSKEPTTNTNDELELKNEIEVVEMVEIII